MFLSNMNDKEHQLYLSICKTKISFQKKVKMLGILLENPNSWRVVGITIDALRLLAASDFKSQSRQGINRAHLVDRIHTFTHLITNPILDCEEWWKYYWDNDRVVLATSSENASNVFSEIIYWNENHEQENDLFATSGFKWKHRVSKEIPYLKKLWQNYTNFPQPDCGLN